jgi:hypothetical protein
VGDLETSRMRSPWPELRRSATGKRKTYLYPKCNELSQLKLSVKFVLPVRGYFDRVKEMSMAVSDGGYQ